MENSVNRSFRNLTIVVFLLLVIPNILKEGLFMDGLIYSTLAHNISEGIGSFWVPSFSETYGTSFYEHPPLAFILQSFFFDLLGDGFYVEKIYSFVTCILTGYFIIKIWKSIAYSPEIKSLYWLPILLWITMPSCFWSYNNNMLENTMGLFSIAATYLLFKSLTQNSWRQIGIYVIAGSLLLMSFLSKGFPGLFPLGFFVCFGMINSSTFKINRIAYHSLLFFLITAVVFLTFFYFNDAARANISNYLNTQVMESLAGERVVGNRFYIMGVLLEQLIITVVLSLTLLGIRYKFSLTKLRQERKAVRTFLLFLIIGLSASAPIMMSPKQLKFYIVPALPYFSLAFSILIAHVVVEYQKRINTKSYSYSIFKYQAYVLVPIIILFSIINFGKTARDHDMIHDVKAIGGYLQKGEKISVSKPLFQRWNLMGYFQRKYHISLDRSGKQNNFLLVEINDNSFSDCQQLDIATKEFKLLQCQDLGSSSGRETQNP